MPANPIEIVLYLTARNETYRVLDGLSSQFQSIGRNVSGLKAALQDSEAVARRAASSIQATAAATAEAGRAMNDWNTLASLQSRGLQDASTAYDAHAAAVTRASSSLSRLRAVQGEIAVAQNVQVRAAADLAQVQHNAARQVAAIPLTGSWRDPASNRFVSIADRQSMVNAIQQQAAADAAVQQQAIDAAAIREQKATAVAQRIAPRATAASQAAVTAEQDAASFAALEAAGSATPAQAAARRIAADEAAAVAAREQQAAERTLLANQAGVGAFARPLAGTAALGAGLLGGAYLAHSIGQYDQFQQTMSQVKALGDPSLNAGQMNQVEQMILQTSAKVGVSPQQGAQAEYYIASAGIKPTESQPVLQAAEQDTFASGEKDVTTATRALVNILNAYHLSTKRVIEVNDQLVSAVRVANATFPDFARGMGSVLAVAPQAGVPFGDVAAAISSMTIKGVSPTESAQDVASLIRAVTSNVPKGAWTYARELGIPMGPTAFSGIGGQQPLTDWLKLFEERTHGDVMAQRVLLGNARAQRAVNDTGGDPNYQAQFVTPVVHAIPGAALDAYTTVADTQAGQTKILMAKLSAQTIETGKQAQGLWTATENLAAPALTFGSSAVGWLTGKAAGGVGDLSNIIANAGQGKWTTGPGGGLDPSAPVTQNDFYRSLNDYIAGNRFFQKDRYQPSTDRKDQWVPYGDPKLGTTMLVQSDSELDKWTKARDALQADVRRAALGTNFRTGEGYSDFAARIAVLEKGNLQYAQGINAYANTYVKDATASAQLFERGDPRVRQRPPTSVAQNEAEDRTLKVLHDMGVAQAKADAAEAGHEADWKKGFTQYNVANDRAGLQSAIDTAQPIKNIMGWVATLDKELAKTPLSVQSKRVTDAQIRATNTQGATAVRDAQAIADQTAIQQTSWTGTAQQALNAQLKAIDTNIAYFKKLGDVHNLTAQEADKGIQRLIAAQAETARVAGRSTTTYSHDLTMGITGQQTLADITASYKADIAAALAQPKVDQASAVQTANYTRDERLRNYNLGVTQNAATMASQTGQFDVAMGAGIAQQRSDLASIRDTALALARKTAGSTEPGAIQAAQQAYTQGGHVLDVNIAQIAQQSAQNTQSFNATMGVSPAQQQADIAAVRETSLALVRLQGGPGEPQAEKAINQQAAAAGKGVDMSVAQINLQAAQTHSDAVQFEYGSIQDQKAAIQQWVVAARALATLQAGGNKTLLGQLLSGVTLQAQQMTRTADTGQSQYAVQSAQLQFDAALRAHDSSTILFQAADKWSAAMEADIKARGLRGPALAAAEQGRVYTRQGMVMQAVQQVGADRTNQVQLDIAGRKSYGLVKADADAAAAWIMANYQAEGISKISAELEVQNLKNTVLGYYRPMNPPTYVDRPYQQPVGNLDVSQGQGVMYIGGQQKASSGSVEALLRQVADLQKQLAMAQQRERYLEMINGHMESIDNKTQPAHNAGHPGVLVGGSRSPKSYGISGSIGGY